MSAVSPPKKAGTLQIAGAVFWSFLGIRRKRDYNRDAVTIRPHQVVIAGLIGALVFVVTLILVVRFVTSQ